MVRGSVIGFFGTLMLVAAVFAFVQAHYFPGMMANAIQDDEFRVNIIDSYRDGDFVRIVYSLTGAKHDSVSVAYTIEDSEGRNVKSGQDEIVTDSNENFGAVKLYLPEKGEYYLTLSASDGKDTSYIRKAVEFPKAIVVGNAVAENNPTFPYVGFIALAVFIGGYFVWHARHRRNKRMLASNLQGRFIHLR